MVSPGEIVREHSGHVAVCCSAIGASPMHRGPDSLTPGVTPSAPAVGAGEDSTYSKPHLRSVSFFFSGFGPPSPRTRPSFKDVSYYLPSIGLPGRREQASGLLASG